MGMAETLVTLAFLSAIAMLLSTIFDSGKWFASLTAAFCGIAFLLSPFDSIQQNGGSVLVIVVSMAILLQYYIKQGISRKYLNGTGGAIILLMLLSMYPQDGINETVNEYLLIENIQELVTSMVIGLLITQLLVNSISIDKRLSIISAVAITILFLLGNLLSRDILPVVIISCALIGFMPLLENKINSNIGSGQGRSRALGLSIAIGIMLIFVSTYVSVSTVNRIGTGDGAIAVSLWITLAITGMGLIGMLLPLMGFDSHPRPEAWGWRISLAFSPMFLTLQTDLASHALLGVLLAIMISISAPLVLEKKAAKAV
tara:strand:- start:111 stop:1055 length:945 start_codon:yes stop_codon:yes gene_type:complete